VGEGAAVGVGGVGVSPGVKLGAGAGDCVTAGVATSLTGSEVGWFVIDTPHAAVTNATTRMLARFSPPDI
jgi:hypothetical protein